VTRSRQETVVPAPLLETKLYVSMSPRVLVARPRLSERMDRGATSRLMLAVPTDERSAAWLSLDWGDNHPVSFWTYVIAALRTVAPGVGASPLALLHAAQPPPSKRC
jgi:LuxR family maltose regulon positive regulatory protein